MSEGLGGPFPRGFQLPYYRPLFHANCTASVYLEMQVTSQSLLLILVCSVLLKTALSFSLGASQRPRLHLCAVHMAVGDDDKKDMKTMPGMKGYYRRPSRAIEKGGGFFVPGLEGERIRLLTSVALFAMFSLNRAGQLVQTLPQIISEVTGLVMALVLFLQGVAELFPPIEVPTELQNSNSGAVPSTYLVTRQISSSDGGKEIVEDVARSILQSCSGLAYVVALNGNGGIIVEVGPVGQDETSMTPQEGSLLAGVAEQTTTDGLDKKSFIATLAAAAGEGGIATGDGFMACMPSSVRSVALRRGYSDTTWLVASTADGTGEALKEQMSWIDSLTQAPFA